MDPYLPPSTHISSVVASLKTTPCLAMPMASKHVRHQGAVEYRLSTRGMPIRAFFRRAQLSFDDRLKGRVTSVRRAPKMPFFSSMLLMGEPSSGIGAAL